MSELINTQNNPVALAVSEFKAIAKPTAYTDLVNCSSAKLRPFAAKYGNSALEAVISSVLVGLSGSLGKPLNGEHIAEVAEYIIDDYPDTKLSDFHLFKKQMLRGEIGGQVGDQLWQLNTRTLIQAWREYYAKREDVFADAREQRHNEEKKAYQDGFIDAYRNSPQHIKDQMNRTVQMLEEKKRSWSEENETIKSKMTLDEIAESEGIDIQVLAEAIRRNALKNIDSGIPEAALLAAELGQITYKARQDAKVLHEYIKT